MKKSLSAIMVIILTTLGASALAAKLDINIKRVAVESQDSTASENEKTGGACRTKITQ